VIRSVRRIVLRAVMAGHVDHRLIGGGRARLDRKRAASRGRHPSPWDERPKEQCARDRKQDREA
jgi:hypothetical protein